MRNTLTEQNCKPFITDITQKITLASLAIVIASSNITNRKTDSSFIITYLTQYVCYLTEHLTWLTLFLSVNDFSKFALKNEAELSKIASEYQPPLDVAFVTNFQRFVIKTAPINFIQDVLNYRLFPLLLTHHDLLAPYFDSFRVKGSTLLLYILLYEKNFNLALSLVTLGAKIDINTSSEFIFSNAKNYLERLLRNRELYTEFPAEDYEKMEAILQLSDKSALQLSKHV